MQLHFDLMREGLSEPEAEMSPCKTNIRIGDTICLRSPHGNMCVNLDDQSSGINWSEQSESCFFTIYAAVGGPRSQQRICEGDVVCLFAANGYFLSYDGHRLAANRPYYIAGPSAEFIVHCDGAMRNGSSLLLRNRASHRLLEVDTQDGMPVDDSNEQKGTSDGIIQHTAETSEFGCLLVQKVTNKHAHTDPRQLKRRLSFPKKNRLLVPRFSRNARRFSKVCAYMSKAVRCTMITVR